MSTAMAKSDKSAKPGVVETITGQQLSINRFVRAFQKCARKFQWREDDGLGLRGRHPEFDYDFHPITAVYWVETGEFVRAWRHHEVAEKIGLGDVSLLIVDCCSPRQPDEGLADTLRRIAGVVKADTSDKNRRRQ
jgi:hypothetical protein